jgi:nucleoside-diphosphate-sugar epimerase
MSDRKTILIVGVTGMLGHRIASAMLARRDCVVRALIRPGGYQGEKARRLDEQRGRGLQTVEGDLLAPRTLPAACRGVDAIVSAVEGGEEVIVGGQTNLIEAADKENVPRMIPSDFSVDLYKLDHDDHASLALRKRAHEAFRGKEVKPTSVLQGTFMEVAVNPILELVDWDRRTFTYWGDGEQPCDFISIADAAKYTAAAALDDGLSGRLLRVTGDVLMMRDLHALLEEFVGRKLEAQHAGSVEDLLRIIDERKRQDPADQYAYSCYQYVLTMVSGKGKLHPLDNDHYPDIRPMTMREFLFGNISRRIAALRSVVRPITMREFLSRNPPPEGETDSHNVQPLSLPGRAIRDQGQVDQDPGRQDDGWPDCGGPSHEVFEPCVPC